MRGFYEMARSTKDWNGVEEDVLGSEKQMERRYRKKKQTNWCAYETGEKRHEKLPSWIREDDVHSINRWKAVCPGGEFTKRFFAGKNVAKSRIGVVRPTLAF